MKYYGGWSFIELYNLPVKIRNYFVNKLGEQLEKENEEVDKARSKTKR
jgi:hypothetical protein